MNINGFRKSPVIKIIEGHENVGVEMKVYDLFVRTLTTKAIRFASARSVKKTLRGAQCAIVQKHGAFRRTPLETFKSSTRSPMSVAGKTCLLGGEWTA